MFPLLCALLLFCVPRLLRPCCTRSPPHHHHQVVSLLWGPTGLRGFAGRLGRAVLSGLAGMPAGKGTKMSLRDMPNARAARDTQAILSADIDWNAPELQNLSASARDFLERLLQVGVDRRHGRGEEGIFWGGAERNRKWSGCCRVGVLRCRVCCFWGCAWVLASTRKQLAATGPLSDGQQVWVELHSCPEA